MAGRDRKRVDVELRSAHLDLTPFMKRKAEDKDAEAGSSGALGATPAEAGAAEPEAGARDEPTAGEETASGEASAESGSEEPAPGEEYVFGEEPLPLDSLGNMDMEVRLGFAEVELGAGLLRDVDSTLTIAEGGLQFEARAKGALEGTIDGSVRLTPSGNGADLSVRAAVQKLRAGLMAGDDVERSEAPLSNLEIELQASGASPRQMAAGANGRLLATSGPGTIDSGLIDMFGAGILGQLAGKLNPFAAEDPHTQLDCTVARVDIVDGQLTVKPVVMQSEKVTVTAAGKVDLPTEKLDFDFNTRPRKGIGISAGMFTNPFIKLGGTLAQPRLGVGAKGVGSGALAAATAGISVLAKGLVDRVAGEMDVCESTLAEAMEDGTPSGEE
jgi:uncharacterized protein involved in outer membrane biogenesis